ncbi:hypothetical protein TNCV_2797231 [Trichonephila clavipes]|nr:hypothetical protein TNCV_2797231 [Trichonephila clavipes]
MVDIKRSDGAEKIYDIKNLNRLTVSVAHVASWLALPPLVAPLLPFFGFLLMSASVPLSPSILSRSARSLSLAIDLIFVRSTELDCSEKEMKGLSLE